MFNLEKSLLDHELIVLRVIGEWWDLDLTGAEKMDCVKILSEKLRQVDLKSEMNFLGPEETAALNSLIETNGRAIVGSFERLHGTIRPMGPGRMERDEPWLDPISPAESLWYRGLLYRAFDESEDQDLVEYYYLPIEFIQQFSAEKIKTHQINESLETYLAAVDEPLKSRPVTTDAVDDITAILSMAQINALQEENLSYLHPFILNSNPDRLSLLFTCAWELELLRATDEGVRPARPIVRWLQKNREEQLRDLADSWSNCSWNELCMTPGIACEGSGWQNDPILARTALLDAMPRDDNWYLISDLVAFIKEHDPDFQRPTGNYDTWYIRDLSSGHYVSGFDNWDLVEGRLLRFLIVGPCAWLGLVSLSTGNSNHDMAYRLSQQCLDWLNNVTASSAEIDVPVVVHDDATISVPFNANRYKRFQVARIADAQPVQPGSPFRYRLTTGSLSRAIEQGIEFSRLRDFLEEASARPLPPSTNRAIERWAENGTEAFLEDVILLRVRDSETLAKLRDNSKTRPFIAESMGDYAAVVRRGDWQRLLQAAAQLGLIIDYESDEGDSS